MKTDRDQSTFIQIKIERHGSIKDIYVDASYLASGTPPREMNITIVSNTNPTIS